MFVFLLTTLNTHLIWSFSASIWFKQLKHTLNVDSNDHQKKQKKRFVTTKNTVQKTFSYIPTSNDTT